MADPSSIFAAFFGAMGTAVGGIIGVLGKSLYDRRDKKDANALALEEAELTAQAEFQKRLMEMFSTLQRQNNEQQNEINILRHQNTECEQKTSQLNFEIYQMKTALTSMGVDLPDFLTGKAIVADTTVISSQN